MIHHKFGPNSLAKMAGIDARLEAIAKRALQLSSCDLTIVEGLRTKERQAYLYSKGRTIPGPIVTWTLNSKHCLGKAIDIAPLNGRGIIPWNDKEAFKEMASCVFAAADQLGVKIRWGSDWNMNGVAYEKGEYDGPHFELVD